MPGVNFPFAFVYGEIKPPLSRSIFSLSIWLAQSGHLWQGARHCTAIQHCSRHICTMIVFLHQVAWHHLSPPHTPHTPPSSLHQVAWHQ